ncbi:MAG: hypothetical protein ACHQ9S_25740 [Candidatus Binatia bacterium]
MASVALSKSGWRSIDLREAATLDGATELARLSSSAYGLSAETAAQRRREKGFHDRLHVRPENSCKYILAAFSTMIMAPLASARLGSKRW